MGRSAGRIAALTSAAVLAGCGAAETTPVAAGDTMAALSVLDTTTEHRPLTAEVFTEADDGQPLDEGDTVRTDATGFAEVSYADGSLTRLGTDTTLTVVALAGDVTVPEVELDLDVGRVWNRVNTVTGERGRFEIRTDVGVAAVRGTAFAVECTPQPVCTFTVTEGVVVLLTLDGREIEMRAGEVVTLGRDDLDTGGTTGADGGGGGTTDGGSSSGGDDDTGDGGETTDSGEATGDDDTAGLRTVEVARTDLADAGTDGGVRTWLERNEPRDAATGRFAHEDQQRCSVTVAGRNLDRATTPETAIQAPIDESLPIDAVATGPLDRYAVDLHFGGLTVRAAEGDVLADESGDRTTFRGEVDVGEHAQWGVGLYEVTAFTTGTVCRADAFIEVTGRSPMTTGTGLLALLALLGGVAGLYTAGSLATSTTTTTATTAPADDPAGDEEASSTSWWKAVTDFFGGG